MKIFFWGSEWMIISQVMFQNDLQFLFYSQSWRMNETLESFGKHFAETTILKVHNGNFWGTKEFSLKIAPSLPLRLFFIVNQNQRSRIFFSQTPNAPRRTLESSWCIPNVQFASLLWTIKILCFISDHWRNSFNGAEFIWIASMNSYGKFN